jgi:hypothetical protein
MNKQSISTISNTFISLILVFITTLSLVGIYFLSGFYVSPFQKIYFNESVSRVQNGGSRNYYLELVVRPELKFDTNTLMQKLIIEPKTDFVPNFKNGLLTIDFGQKLNPDTQYTLKFEKGVNLPTLDTFAYNFTTQKPTLNYLQEKNTAQSAIMEKVVGGEPKTLIKKAFILMYSMTPEYIIYSYRDNSNYATAVDIAVYNKQSQTTRVLTDKYNQFFQAITDEQSNQAVISKDDSSYSLLDMATLDIKPLTGIDGKFNTFLAFASPQFLIYNTVTYSSNTILYDIKSAKGTLIGKYAKVLGVDNLTGNICLSSYDKSNKVFVYSTEGKTTELSVPVQETDELVTNSSCDKIGYKTLIPDQAVGFISNFYDDKSKKNIIFSTETSVPSGEFIIDNSGKYLGYNTVVGSGIKAYNAFNLHNEQSFAAKKPLETIKNITNLYIY